MRASKGFSPEIIRSEFPFLKSRSNIHYLDNAATSQKPQCVINSIVDAYTHFSANVHRGVYQLSEDATKKYEDTRLKVASFIGNVDSKEVIFTSGTTHAINLVAKTWGEDNIKQGDEILLTVSEHHSNIVPWQMLAKKKGALIKYIPLDHNFRLDLAKAKTLISNKTKLLAFTHVSNVLGYISPVKELIDLAKSHRIVTLIDGAQAVPHLTVNVKEIDCDFYCFSSHKMLGPTGVGVLYGKKSILESMPPFFGGGDMISHVNLENFGVNSLPYKFEAGTPPIAQVLGLAAAIDFLDQWDRNAILKHDKELGQIALNALQKNSNINLYTTDGDDWIGVVSFAHKHIHPHDLAAFQNSMGVCIRAGHHCAQPLMNILNATATVRISPYLYNTPKDIEIFLLGLKKAEETFGL